MCLMGLIHPCIISTASPSDMTTATCEEAGPELCLLFSGAGITSPLMPSSHLRASGHIGNEEVRDQDRAMTLECRGCCAESGFMDFRAHESKGIGPGAHKGVDRDQTELWFVFRGTATAVRRLCQAVKDSPTLGVARNTNS